MMARMIWLGLSGALLSACVAKGASVDWVRNGKPAATIAIAKDPTRVVQSAVAELQHHLKRMTGTALPAATVRLAKGGHVYELRNQRYAGHTDRVRVDLAPTESKPGDHVVRLDVYDATGKLNLAYTRNILTTAGQATGRIRLALDDPRGVWRLKVIDTISGCTNEARVAVWATAP